ncbi:hypothetical protein CEUSTIGMA_g4424.t1 [Chlamydomonas eustigma]|uniref:Kinesin motor domain-containing protein n=1 Tax=Chlamydomonas eustigma TaxID=1157962 RepID=A0A250X1L9_9CHLO|nr:hypothetical protein CEUSTIGMA_g4424.t1 [Chlamydomonas eustigma]|eukprot:GAX76977.1 hypothetical protein CEUSTIGMA_g4424.t1 [Chlamydomonas eustigma]
MRSVQLGQNHAIHGPLHTEFEKATSQERVQVFVRVRPLTPQEIAFGEVSSWTVTGLRTLNCLEDIPTPVGGKTTHNPNLPSSFTYNQVFPPDSTSDSIYTSVALPIVTASMQGYNGTVFAYGQTGSGKTYTMRSLMRKCAASIFEFIKAHPEREFLLRLSALEIYNEEVRDLMMQDNTSTAAVSHHQQQLPAAHGVHHGPSNKIMSHKSGGGSGHHLDILSAAALMEAGPPAAASNSVKGLRVQDDAFKGVHVEGLQEEGLRSAEHLEMLLTAVEAKRHVCDTKMNQNSSRSHQIVRISIESRPAALRLEVSASGRTADPTAASSSPPATSSVTISVLNLVDLAGSERLSQAALEDADREKLRQKEASNINKSLLTLGLVIRSLGEPNIRKHVPYRESKLTRILQNSLSGNSHMAIICTISPAAGSVENTRAALYFANAAKNVVMRPHVNEVTDDKTLIRRMQAEIAALKRQLSSHGPHVEAQSLTDALSAKEELVKQVAEEKEGLQRRLAGLERLILRGDGLLVKQRHSVNGSLVSLASMGSQRTESRMLSDNDEVDSATSDLHKTTPGNNHELVDQEMNRVLHAPTFLNTSSMMPPNKSGALPANSNLLTQKTTRGDRLVPAVGAVRTSWNPPSVTAEAWRGESMTRMTMMTEVDRVQPASLKSTEKAEDVHHSSHLQEDPGLKLVSTQEEVLPATHKMYNEESLLDLQKETGTQFIQHEASLSLVHYPQAPASTASISPAASSSGRPPLPSTGAYVIVSISGSPSKLGSAISGTERFYKQPLNMTTSSSLIKPVPKLNFSTLTAGPYHQGSKLGIAQSEKQPPLDDSSSSRMTDLQAELTCIKLSCSQLPDIQSAIKSLQDEMSRLEVRQKSSSALVIPAEPDREVALHSDTMLLEKLRAEVARLQATQAAGIRADQALEALQKQFRNQDNGFETADNGMDSNIGFPEENGLTENLGLDEDIPPLSHRYRQAPADSVSSSSAVTASGHVTQPLAELEEGEEEDTAASGPSVSRAPSRSLRFGGRHHVVVSPGGLTGNAQSPDHALSAASKQLLSSTVRSTTTSPLPQVPSHLQELQVNDRHALRDWYQSEVRRMRADFKASASQDVQELGTALNGLKEHNQRLEMHKRLLLGQVLKLEEELASVKLQHQGSDLKIAALISERDRAKFEAVQAKHWAKAAEAAVLSSNVATATGRMSIADVSSSHDMLKDELRTHMDPAALAPGQSMLPPERRLSIFDADDSWSAKDTPESLLPQILEAWEKLAVPLVYRSRFFLDLKEKDVFYYEMEFRRLEWKKSRIEASKGQFGGRSKELERAIQALDWEQKNLAQNLKWNFTDEERERLMQEWGVNIHTKGRKLQLVRRLWHPQTLRQAGGSQRSAELVVALSDMDACGQFLELVFGEQRLTGVKPSPLGAVVSSIVKRVSTPRNLQGVHASQAQTTISGAGTEAAMSTPRRNSLMGSFTSKLRSMSMLSKRGPQDQSILTNIPAAGSRAGDFK